MSLIRNSSRPQNIQDTDKFILCIVTERPEQDEENPVKPTLVPFTKASIAMYKEDGEGKITLHGQKQYGSDEKPLDEKQFIAEIWGLMDKYKPTLVTYGGRSFLLPRMRLISMKEGLKCSWLNRAGDKWANFGSRYNAQYHADLMDILSEYGAGPLLSLTELYDFMFTEEKEEGVTASQLLYSVYEKWNSFARG